MLSQLLNEPYFDSSVLPPFKWKQPLSPRIDSYSFYTALYFWMQNEFNIFRYKGRIIDSDEKMFDLIDENLEEAERILLDQLMRIMEYRSINFLDETPRRAFPGVCRFLGIPEYVSDRNVAKLLLLTMNEQFID